MKPYTEHRTGQNKEKNTYNKRIMLGCMELYNSRGIDIYLRGFYKLNKIFSGCNLLFLNKKNS